MALLKCVDCERMVSDAATACPGCGRPIKPTIAAAVAGQPVGETILFEDGDVVITSKRAVFSRTTTYAMSNVTSVREFIEEKPTFLALVGFLLLAWGTGCVALVRDGAYGGILGLVGACFLAGYFFTPQKHWVMVGTSGAEARAVSSPDPNWTKRVVEAMNAAIISRQ